MIKEKNEVLYTARGPLQNLLDNLSGRNGKEWLGIIKAVLRKENPFPEKENRNREIWKTITLPAYRYFYPNTIYAEVQGVQEVLTKLGMEIYGRALHMLEMISYNNSARSVDVVLVSLEELGFSKEYSPSYFEIKKKAQKRGLSKLPAIYGAIIRETYVDQPASSMQGEAVYIGMDLVNEQIFELHNNRGHIVLASIFVRGTFTHKCRFAFQLCRKVQH